MNQKDLFFNFFSFLFAHACYTFVLQTTHQPTTQINMRLNPEFFEDTDKDFNPEDNSKLIKHLSDLPKEVAEMMERQRDAIEEMVADLQESSSISEEEAWQEIAIFQGLQLNMLQKAVVGLQKAVFELSKKVDE